MSSVLNVIYNTFFFFFLLRWLSSSSFPSFYLISSRRSWTFFGQQERKVLQFHNTKTSFILFLSLSSFALSLLSLSLSPSHSTRNLKRPRKISSRKRMKCVKIMQSQSKPSCEAIHKRLICPEFIILWRSFPSDIFIVVLLLLLLVFREFELWRRHRQSSRFQGQEFLFHCVNFWFVETLNWSEQWVGKLTTICWRF